jgi:membrane peptidoglycan carboxypeptidase
MRWPAFFLAPPRWAKLLAAAVGAIAALSTITLWALVRHYEKGLPAVAELKTYQPPQVTRVLARDGTLLAELFTQRRTVVPIATLPAHVKLAVLAAEDAGFYEHEGLNYWGIARALLVNLRSRSTRQGGSTITQQVVKNLLLVTHERTLSRKIREALLARRLEQDLTKNEIFELYLNNIYFGRGRYGIEEAARDDFGKSAKDLTIAEAALISGRIANPRDFHPPAWVPHHCGARLCWTRCTQRASSTTGNGLRRRPSRFGSRPSATRRASWRPKRSRWPRPSFTGWSPSRPASVASPSRHRSTRSCRPQPGRLSARRSRATTDVTDCRTG